MFRVRLCSNLTTNNDLGHSGYQVEPSIAVRNISLSVLLRRSVF
jgi:hypothetical protein